MSIRETTYLSPEHRFSVNQIGFNKIITRAKGNYLYSEDGQAYLDFLSQFGAIPFGHNPDFLWETLNSISQEKQPTFIHPFISPVAEELARELTVVAPSGMRYVSFTNGGIESVETSVRVALAKTRRQVILVANSSFYSKIPRAVCTDVNPLYQPLFLPNTSYFEHIAYGNLETLEARLAKKDVAALIIEPLQAGADMIAPPPGYLLEASRLCRKAGTLFVMNEAQTGLGRTGYLFATERENIEVDVLLLAEALGGGLIPLGACLCSENAWSSEFDKYPRSTFVNSHLSCSLGLATLNHLLKDDQTLLCQVKQRGEYLRQKLEDLVKAHPTVFQRVSGQGLMQRIHLAPWSGESSWAMLYASSTGNSVALLAGYLLNEHHIVACPTTNVSNVLCIEPPLTIEEAEIERLTNALEDAAKLLKREDYASLLSFTIGESVKSVAIPKEVDFSRVRSSAQPASPKGECRGKFAFLTHVPGAEDFMKMLPPAINYFQENQKTRFNQWVTSWASSAIDPDIAYHVPALHSKAGGYVEGWIIANLLTSRQILELPRRERAKLMQDYVNLARSLGADVIGLGAFTSVITDAGTTIADCGLIVTTGNSLTAIASAESLKIVAKARDIDLGAVKVGIVGAGGSVGRTASKALVSTCKQLVLFGNPANLLASQNLRIVAGELYRDAIHLSKLSRGQNLKGVGMSLNTLIPDFSIFPSDMLEDDSDDGFIRLYEFIEEHLAVVSDGDKPIQFTVDLERYLPKMSAIISATSQGHSFIDPALLGANAIVCDAARPNDVLANVKDTRPDVFVYEGGLVTLPENICFGLSNFGAPKGVTIGCCAEMIVLAMSGVNRNYSIGKRVPLSEAMEVYNMARQHGFEVYVPDLAAGKTTSITENVFAM